MFLRLWDWICMRTFDRIWYYFFPNKERWGFTGFTGMDKCPDNWTIVGIAHEYSKPNHGKYGNNV